MCFNATLLAPNADFDLDLGGLWFKFWFNGIFRYVVYSFDYDFLSAGIGFRECW